MRGRWSTGVCGVIIATVAFGLTACGANVSYTKQHCEAFRSAWDARDPSVGDELLTLVNPPEGESVTPAVKDLATRLTGILLTDGPEDVEADLREALLAECAKVKA
jgi:hypothetical protein